MQHFLVNLDQIYGMVTRGRYDASFWRYFYCIYSRILSQHIHPGTTRTYYPFCDILAVTMRNITPSYPL